jgi:hypothetical protein
LRDTSIIKSLTRELEEPDAEEENAPFSEEHRMGMKSGPTREIEPYRNEPEIDVNV